MGGGASTQSEFDIKDIPDEVIVAKLKQQLEQDPARVEKLFQMAKVGNTDPAISSDGAPTLLEATTGGGTDGGSQPAEVSATAPSLVPGSDDRGTHEFLTKSEEDVLSAFNLARTNPTAFVDIIQKQLDTMDSDNVIWLEGRSVGIKTHEGRVPFEEAIKALQEQAALEPVTASYGLTLAARDHCVDIGLKAQMGHKGSDDSSPGDRVERYGKWVKTMGENLDFGDKSGMEAIVALLIDDGTPSRGHRKNIFTVDFKTVGVGVGLHARFGRMFAMDMAGGFKDKPREEQDGVHAEKVAQGKREGLTPTGECPGCSQAIYETEQGTMVEDKKWHNRCFVCQNCFKTMQSFVAHEGKPMCRECYEEKVALKCVDCSKAINGKYMMQDDNAVCEECWKKKDA